MNVQIERFGRETDDELRTSNIAADLKLISMKKRLRMIQPHGDTLFVTFFCDGPGRSRSAPSLIVHLPTSSTRADTGITKRHNQPFPINVVEIRRGSRKIRFVRLPIGSLN